MRKTLTMFAAVVGALVLALLAASPAQATQGTNLTFWVNEDNGVVSFVGDPGPNDSRESIVVCDRKADGYNIAAWIDTDRNGYADYQLRASGNGNCTGVQYINVPEERRMYIWACMENADGARINCTDGKTIYA